MSIPTSLQGLRLEDDKVKKIGNKIQMDFSHSGDDNANRLSSITHDGRRGIMESGYRTSPTPPLVSQTESPDKFVFWGSEQQCMEPELTEFGLLNCQGIHNILGSSNQEQNEGEEDDGGSVRDGKDEGPMSISSSSTASSVSIGGRKNDNDSNKMESGTEWGMVKKISCHSTEELDTCVTASAERRENRSGRDRRRGALKESKSETNVFVSSLSSVSLSGSLSSALNSNGEASPISFSSSRTSPYPGSNNATSAQSTRRASVDANQNSPPLNPQQRQDFSEPCGSAQTPEERSYHRNGLTSGASLSQRRKAGFEERGPPPRRQQLVRPLCQTEFGKERNFSPSKTQQSDAAALTSLDVSVDLNKKFTRSSLREPSDFSHLYNTSGMSQLRQPHQTSLCNVPSAQRQPPTTVQHRAGLSNPSPSEKRPQTQLTYRRNCQSPNRTGIESRSSTPPHSPLRTPQGSPRRQPSMFFISRNVSGATKHISSGCNPAVLTSTQGLSSSFQRAPVKSTVSTTGIPRAPLNNQQSSPNSNPKESSPSPKLKPKGVRPKIITYVRKSPHIKPQTADGPYQVYSLPARLSTNTQTPASFKDSTFKPETETQRVPILSASNLLYDKYRQEMQANIIPAGMQGRSIRAPGHSNTVHSHSHTAPPKLGSKGDNSYVTTPEVARSNSLKGSSAEDALQGRAVTQMEGGGSLLRSGRGLRLGLGAVTRNAASSTKSRAPGQGLKSTLIFSQPVQPVNPTSSMKDQDNTDGQLITHHAPAPALTSAAAASQSVASRSLLSKVSQSGLRPPGFNSSRLPTGRLAAFGFVRSSSVSSVSSAHSADSAQSDPCHRLSVSEDPPPHRVATGSASSDQQRGVSCRSNSLQPPSTPALPRRYLPPQPRSSPGVGRKELQRTSEVTRSLPSSPKRLAVVPPKPQSPVQPGQRPAATVKGSALSGSHPPITPLRLQQEQPENLQREKEEAQQREREKHAEDMQKEQKREEVQRLQGRCEEQEKQLQAMRQELKKASLGLEAFIITTQRFCLKNDHSVENNQKLSMEIQKMKEEMASTSARWERLQRDKTALEAAFELQLQELQMQQEEELAAVEEGLRKCHVVETEHLKVEHCAVLEELRTQQQEQMEEMTANHQATVQELRDMHNITMATLHEEHARTMRDLRKAHEQQKTLLEEDFEKLRLSLQDQVDTLTFQNQSLREKAKRFEEALRKSTDEQIIEALAPYQHIDKDLKSLKVVVEIKNQQIHQQEKKIADLEKVAQKNVFLEEKVQVLQQQNEDLKARIEMKLAMSRQLSEENANLQESVEKESTEKKRLSQNNEELLWLLQTSPLMSPASSPLHRSFSTSPVPSSPLFSSSPLAGCDSPSHCHGCSQQAQFCSPSHRGVANANLSPGPATPTHRGAVNQNYSPGPATPTHRPSSGHCNSYSRMTSLQN
ncbi:microtubule-associated tumor suppressor candidate 2 homolog isoform X2 [Oryzias latipes]|uniref:Microtubule associated tumor suppressor candidate 2a n=2 Tax=Oryzias TaxID=8089 RepID=A0A3B3H8J3_ORYLA|nr:microtubule-associated tumor suppressor candidate 2 homolog isoform X2 [Oryzias latipes]